MWIVYIPYSLYKAQELQVVGNTGVVTEGTTVLIAYAEDLQIQIPSW